MGVTTLANRLIMAALVLAPLAILIPQGAMAQSREDINAAEYDKRYQAAQQRLKESQQEQQRQRLLQRQREAESQRIQQLEQRAWEQELARQRVANVEEERQRQRQQELLRRARALSERERAQSQQNRNNAPQSYVPPGVGWPPSPQEVYAPTYAEIKQSYKTKLQQCGGNTECIATVTRETQDLYASTGQQMRDYNRANNPGAVPGRPTN